MSPLEVEGDGGGVITADKAATVWVTPLGIFKRTCGCLFLWQLKSAIFQRRSGHLHLSSWQLKKKGPNLDALLTLTKWLLCNHGTKYSVVTKKMQTSTNIKLQHEEILSPNLSVVLQKRPFITFTRPTGLMPHICCRADHNARPCFVYLHVFLLGFSTVCPHALSEIHPSHGPLIPVGPFHVFSVFK